MKKNIYWVPTQYTFKIADRRSGAKISKQNYGPVRKHTPHTYIDQNINYKLISTLKLTYAHGRTDISCSAPSKQFNQYLSFWQKMSKIMAGHVVCHPDIQDDRKKQNIYCILAATCVQHQLNKKHPKRAFASSYRRHKRPETTCRNMVKNSVFWSSENTR